MANLPGGVRPPWGLTMDLTSRASVPHVVTDNRVGLQDIREKQRNMADGEGFEPPEPLLARLFSKQML